MKKQILKRRLRLVFFAIYIVAFFWWMRATGFEGAGTAIVGALVLGGALGLVGMSFRLKQIFLRSFAPQSLRAGSPAEFPDLDRAELERLTHAWQQLGFEPRGDRAGNMDNARGGQTFSRSFEHPAQGAVAEISQIFLPTQVVPFSSSVASFWGERAPVLQRAQQLRAAAPAPLAAPLAPTAAPALPDEMELWMLVTHNRAPNKFWVLMRQRRLLARRLPREATPEALWQAHQQQRADVGARLQLPHLRGDLEALLEAHGVVLSAQLRARLARTPAWKFGVARLSRAQSPARYDGELPAPNSP